MVKIKRNLPMCWNCGRKLWGSKHVKLRYNGDGHIRVLHKTCAKEIMETAPGAWTKESEQ